MREEEALTKNELVGENRSETNKETSKTTSDVHNLNILLHSWRLGLIPWCFFIHVRRIIG